MLIYCILMYLYALFMCLQAYKRAAGAFLPAKEGSPGFWDYVNSGNCQNCQNFGIYGFGDLSKKTRAGKS